jgi:hypothetical protein
MTSQAPTPRRDGKDVAKPETEHRTRWGEGLCEAPARATDFDEGPVGFDFSGLFGRARGRGRGADVQATYEMDLHQAIEGAEVLA